MSQRIFISSVQREFAKERKADGVYLHEVDECDIYLGIFGHTYGNTDSAGVSATEREYLRAAAKHKYRICFGTGDIIEKCRENGLPPPQWENEDDGLTITLRRATITSQPQADRRGVNASQTVPKHHGDALDDALESRLFDALRKESSLDQVELSKILGVSRATVQRCFKRLLGAGKVVRVGGKRFGHWEVIG